MKRPYLALAGLLAFLPNTAAKAEAATTNTTVTNTTHANTNTEVLLYAGAGACAVGALIFVLGGSIHSPGKHIKNDLTID